MVDSGGIIDKIFLPGTLLAAKEGNGNHSITIRLMSGSSCNNMDIFVSDCGMKLLQKSRLPLPFRREGIQKNFAHWNLPPHHYSVNAAQESLLEQRAEFPEMLTITLCTFKRKVHRDLKDFDRQKTAGMQTVFHDDGSETLTVWVQETTSVTNASNKVSVASCGAMHPAQNNQWAGAHGGYGPHGAGGFGYGAVPANNLAPGPAHGVNGPGNFAQGHGNFNNFAHGNNFGNFAQRNNFSNGGNFASPQPNFASPQPNFASPAPSNMSVDTNFASPQPNFASPQPNFASPQPNHAAPQPNYGVPQPNFQSPQPMAFAQANNTPNPSFPTGPSNANPSSFGVPPSGNFSVPIDASTAPKPAPASSGPHPTPHSVKRSRSEGNTERAYDFLQKSDLVTKYLVHEFEAAINEGDVGLALEKADDLAKHLNLAMKAAVMVGDEDKYNAFRKDLDDLNVEVKKLKNAEQF